MHVNKRFLSLTLAGVAWGLSSGCSTDKSTEHGDQGTSQSQTGGGGNSVAKPATSGGTLQLTVPPQLSGTPAATIIISLDPVGSIGTPFPIISPAQPITPPTPPYSCYNSEILGATTEAAPAISSSSSYDATLISPAQPIGPCGCPTFYDPSSDLIPTLGTSTVNSSGTVILVDTPVTSTTSSGTAVGSSISTLPAIFDCCSCTGSFSGTTTAVDASQDASDADATIAGPIAPVNPNYTSSFAFVAGQTESMPNVAAGTYTVTVELLDASGNLLQEGSTTTTVTAGQTSQANVTLHAVGNGTVDVSITPASN